MATQGIQLPVSLQISNLQEIANQLKQFANKNVLADSLGGKKIDSELNKILSRLDQISAKSKTAFTTQGDFNSVQKDIGQVELSLNKVQDTIKNLNFSDLKVPDEFSGQITALQSRIRELNGELTTFKGTQKEKLVNNTSFLADLQAADPKQAAKWLEKGYDELYKSINDGMTRVNTLLSLKAAEFKDKQNEITQNSSGKTSMTQWGALEFIQQAFKTLPSDNKQRNTAQEWISQFMREAENGKEFSGFSKGAAGMNNFLRSLQEKFSFSDEQMTQIRVRIREQVQKLREAGEKEATAATLVKRMGSNEGLAKQILFGNNANDIELQANKYANSIRDAQRILQEKTQLETRSDAFTRVQKAFDLLNEEIKQKASEIAAALQVPQEALKGFEAYILSAATKSPELANLFQKATGEIGVLTNTVEYGKQKLQSIDNTISKMQGVSNFINRYVGLYAIVRKVTQAIRSAFNNIKELDKAITGIAVVTNMSQQDLWGKIGQYTQMAQQYGVATKDVYTVSQIFYQQGLQTAQVMSMTTESLKMAKIAGIDYSTAANAMTVAIRAFKLEMSEAQQVTDTYSALAAKFAVSSSEIANAMEKTASSAASVGMSLQSTSAFISVMEQTTREGAQNIGSALKSIISRYGEMKASPAKLLEVDGEEVAFNKVDTALKSIGISIKDSAGQFRDFDDVIMELSQKWDSLDNNTQRYIATIMAGNRQQSRFIALVSNYDELNRAMNVASNSENASIVQVAKTMDSLESKANQLKNAFSQIYLDLHAEEGLKSMYDWLTRILKTIGKLGMLKGVIPTLMNVIGFGTGAKSLVKTGMNALQTSKTKLQVQTDAAQQQIDQIRARASEDIIAKYKIETDLSQLQTAQAQLETQTLMAQTNASNALLAMQPGRFSEEQMLGALSRASQSGMLETPEGRAKFMDTWGGIKDPTSAQGQYIDGLLQSLARFSGQLDQISDILSKLGTDGQKTGDDLNSAGEKALQGGDKFQTAGDQVGGSAGNAGGALDGIGQAASNATPSIENLGISTEVGSGEVATGTSNIGQSLDSTTPSINGMKQGADNTTGAFNGVIGAAGNLENKLNNIPAPGTTPPPQGGTNPPQENPGEKESTGLSWTNWGNGKARAIAGAASSAARLVGTTITAAGAAHQDKSTNSIETSKILTGIGNGVSMAGTGASMGMAFGPWGAAIGAIGGFLFGGLGAIIDGANMTLKERLALETEEAQKASDEALKAQAKSTDMASQIDNLKALRKTMYDSAENMAAYKEAMNSLASQYPQLVSAYDSAGNAIIDLSKAEEELTLLRQKAATAAREAAVAEAKTRKTSIEIIDNFNDTVKQATEGQELVKVGGNYGEKVTGFRIQSDRGASAPMYVIEGTNTGRAFDDYATKDLSGQLFNQGFEGLKASIKAGRKTGDSVVDSIVQYYIDNPDAVISKSDFSTLGRFMLNQSKFENIRTIGTATLDWSSDPTDRLFENFILHGESAESNALNFGQTEILKKMDEFIAENGEKLGITAKTAREFLNVGDKDEIDFSVLEEGWRRLEALGARYNKNAKTLDRNVTRAYATEELEMVLPFTNMSTEKESKISGAKIFSSILAQGLESAAKEAGEENAAEWATKDATKAAFTAKKKELGQSIVNWASTLSDSTLEAFIADSDQMDAMFSADEIIKKYHITDPEIQEAIIRQFSETNQEKRNEILNAVYATDETGKRTYDFNEKDFAGIARLNTGKGFGSTIAQSIAGHFAEFSSNPIITKYASFFTEQLSDINKLAEDGYTELANKRLLALEGLSTVLANIKDDKLQNDLFGTITNIDFSSWDSIDKAYDAIMEYGKQQGKEAEVAPLLAKLDEAKKNLIFNVTTMVNELINNITEASKEMESTLSSNKSGFSFDQALKEFEKLQSRYSDIKFEDMFIYDAALGKYVLSAEGLQKSMEARSEAIAEEAENTAKAAEVYTGDINNQTKIWRTEEKLGLGSFESTERQEHFRWGTNQYREHQYDTREQLERVLLEDYQIDPHDPAVQAAIDRATGQGAFSVAAVEQEFLTAPSHTFISTDDLMNAIERNGADMTHSPQYQQLAIEFMKSDQEHTWDNWIAFIENYAEEKGKEAAWAQQAVEEFEKNQMNLYAGQTDWGKLATGTDFSGTNRQYQQLLIKEINKRRAKRGQFGLREDISWESTVNAYLDEVYGTDAEINALTDEVEKNQKKLQKASARTSFIGQTAKAKSDQVSTAINEMLAGEGQVLSDTSIALIGQTEGLELPANGVLKAGDDFINSAIKLYKAHEKNLVSIAAKNEAYSAIMTKSFEQANETINALSSGASLDISSLSTLFTTFGLEIADYYDAATRQWTTSIPDIFDTDMYGKTQIKDWNKFIQFMGLEKHIDLRQYMGTFEYQNAYSSYVDGLIKLDTQATDLIRGQYDAAFSSITQFKQLNVSAIVDKNPMLAGNLALNGAGTIENGILKINDTIQYAHNAIGVFSYLSTLSDEALYEETGWTQADLAKNWKAAQTVLTESYNAWNGIAGNLTSLTDDNVATLMEKGGLKINDFGKLFEKVGDNYVLELEAYGDYLVEAVGGKGATYASLNSYQKAQVDKAMEKAEDAIVDNLSGLSWEKVINGTASNSEITAFQENLMGSLVSLGFNDHQLERIFSVDSAGKTTINLNALREEVARSNTAVGKAFSKSLETTIATVRDAALTEINNAINYSFEGTNNLSDVNAFVQRYNELTGQNKKIDDLFGYDTMQGTFTLNNKALEEYQQAQKEYLISLGMNEEMVNAYIKHQTEEMFQSNLDISSFLDGGYLTPGSKDTQKLISQIQQLSGLTGKAAEMFADNMLNAMLKGGDRAVWALKRLKGADNVTAEEIAKAYRGKADKLNESLEHIGTQAGEIVDSYTASIFESAGAQVKDLGNGQFVIESIPNENWGEKIAGAYLKLYNTLKKTAGSTVSELNSAYAKILTASQSSQINPIEALSDAASMTYEALGEILAKEGKFLEDVIGDPERYGIEFLGAGKVQIADFTKFAKQMGWDTNSPEYTKAFKAHNDALIEMDSEASEAIMEEVKSLKDAKIGDKINLTYLWTAAQKEMNTSQQRSLMTALSYYGAQFKDGILTIGANANIQGIITTIAQTAAQYGNLLPDELAELADVVAEYIEGIINIINNGIKGSLSNTEAQQLQSWADMQGLGKLDFTQTAEGLKLSQQSAMKLYFSLRQVDNIKAKLVFNELNDSLKETNENYKSISSIMARIAWIEDQRHPERAEQYREELALAKEILAVRSTSEDDSFNFMSNDIPGAQKNPLNYAKNWTQAFQTIRDAFKVKKGGKKGFINYEDWYNIVTEMNNLAKIGGPIQLGALKLDGSLEAASAAIQAGADSLTAIDTGEVKVNLGAAGINIKSGADALNSGVTDGLHAMAKSQVEMLDGLIAMLELIVSMEQLGDIDTDNNGIQWEEMFTFDEASGAINGFNKNFENWLKYCKEQIANGNKDLQKAFAGIKIGNVSLEEMLYWSPEQFENAEPAVKKMLPAMMTALKKAAESGDWDLDNIGDSMISILKAHGFDGTIPIDIGDMTLFISGNSMVTVDWSDINTEEILKDISKNKEEAQKNLREWIQNYQNNEYLTDEQLEFVLRATGVVKIENGETKVTVGGKTYSGKDAKAAMRTQALLDQGFDFNADELIEEARKNNGTVDKKYEMGKHTIQIVYNDTGIHIYDDKGTEYDSRQDLLEKAWEKYEEDNKDNPDALTKEEFFWVEYGIHANIKTTITFTDNGKEVDLETDPEARAKVQELREKGAKFLEENLHQKQDGNYELNYKGLTFTFSADEIETGDVPSGEKVSAVLGKALGLDQALGETITDAIVNAFKTLGDTISDLDATPARDVATALSEILTNAKSLSEFGWEELGKKLGFIQFPNNSQTEIPGSTEGSSQEVNNPPATLTVDADTTEAEKKVQTFKETKLEPGVIPLDAKDENATTKATEIANKINAMSAAIRITASNSASGVITAIHTALDNLVNSGPYRVTVEAQVYMGGGGNAVNFTKATGNLGLARAQGTLMGELGPELVVSNGRYFVAGQNGPEMVDLADDAIVFNHLQTKSLLEKGISSGRGKAVTNERNAVSFAKGNINGGPAMASAAAALAALKELRAQWQALMGLSAKDLAGKGGSGGGGGGNKAFIKDLEKWYNWLQRIAQLEQDITYEEAKRSKIQSDRYADGKKYYKSQVESLKKLQEEAEIHADLAASQQTYFNQRRNELNSDKNPFNSLYWFNTDGQLIYKDGKLEELSNMVGSDKYNNPNMTAEEQYKYITGTLGIDKKYLQYDSSGNKIEGTDYTSMVQAFWDKIDSDKEEMQSLHDSIAEHEKAVLEMEQKRNEILNEMRDNQISLEEAVLDAMTQVAQREIDALQKQRDAIEAANSAMIQGLSDALAREQQIYQNNQSAVELDKMRRQLAILQRSGGSAAEISSLQSQIDESAQQLYFDKQQEQIDLLQAASDAQLEKLDKQIDLMTETLAYEKEHGLLWSKVHEIMEKSPEDIATYIQKNNAEFWGLSPVANEKKYRETLFSAEQWTEYAKNIESITEKYTGSSAAKAKAAANNPSEGSGSGSGSGSGGSGSGGSGSKSGGKSGGTGGKTNKEGNKKSGMSGEQLEQKYGNNYGKNEYSGSTVINIAAETRSNSTNNRNNIYTKENTKSNGDITYRQKKIYKSTYATGGIVEADGQAYLHADEAVLTPEQTRILRNDILGSNNNSLLNLLQDFRAAMAGTSNDYSSINNNNGITIEHAEVNMHVDKLANGYDAAKAGQDVMTEMLRIARKTTTNKVGR